MFSCYDHSAHSSPASAIVKVAATVVLTLARDAFLVGGNLRHPRAPTERTSPVSAAAAASNKRTSLRPRRRSAEARCIGAFTFIAADRTV